MVQIRKARKATKREQEKFLSSAEEIIKRLGGVPLGPKEMYDWKLETRYGPLVLFLDASGSGPGTCFTRFLYPKRAVDATACNPYSGKWNHHYFKDTTLETALELLENSLRGVVPS